MNQKTVIGIVAGLIIVAAVGYVAYTRPAEPSRPEPQTITVYFVDTKKFQAGTEPYEAAVERRIPGESDPMQAVLDEYFKGPTAEEKAQGLSAVYSEARGAVLQFDPEERIARVKLLGGCNSQGAAYNIGSLIFKNLQQFPDMKAIRIYDPEGQTLYMDMEFVNSSPACLEP